MMPADTARLRFWMDNPNETGAFLALLTLGLLAVPCVWWRFVLQASGRNGKALVPNWCAFVSIRGSNPIGSLVTFLSLGAALALTLPLAVTQSRGALAALGAGAVSLAFGWRKAPGLRWLPISLLLFASAAFLIGPGGPRVASAATGNDRSILSRVEVYSAVPRMAAAAPLGWGLGQGGQAYSDWFQPTHQRHTFKHLLGTHATLLVEVGWVPAVLAAALCGMALSACFWGNHAALPDWSHVAGAMLVTFLIAGVFNHVALEPMVCALGILPSAVQLIDYLARDGIRWPRDRSPSGHRWALPASIGAAVPALVIAIGHFPTRDSAVRRAVDGTVSIGIPAAPTIYIAHPDPRVTGSTPGREVRAALTIGVRSRSREALAKSVWRDRELGHSKSDVGCWELVRVLPPHPNAPPASIPALVLSGRAQGMTAEWLRAANRIAWINPPLPSTFAPDLADALQDVATQGRLSILAGELLGPEYFGAWRTVLGEAGPGCLTACSGRGQIITDFPQRTIALIDATKRRESSSLLLSKQNTRPNQR